ncbi:uncharacterized protein LOC114445053 [Parambassis ranga]|uniref:ribonuclease H n=1 Tax=Parambassis ranga TaxID=210632 RepID=A0A6P7JFW9_9TELE|nr:uncharacterized protein LOC114445053 [Parambassis ranga]
MRAILDLRALNHYLRKYKFRMLTHASLLRFVLAGDWFTSVDLRDAYFHIPVYPPHWKFLRFAFRGTAYEFMVLPFGLSLSPRVFVKCTEAAVAPLRERGIRVATYIDDRLVAASTPREAAHHTDVRRKHLVSLGFRLNMEKSMLTPSQCITFVGLTLDVISTDASLTDWGATHEGKTVNGKWGPHMHFTHINCLELIAVHLALKHFLPWLWGHHVLVRTDNSTVVAYINRQGGLRSLRLHALAHRLIVWSNVHFQSLRATHVPGILNCGADLLSRGIPLYADWRLHPEVVKQIWLRYGRATVDLYASAENAQCPLFFSRHDGVAPLGIDALAHEWPRALLYAFPPVALISPTLARVREKRLVVILVAPHWPAKHWMAEIYQLLVGTPWQLPLCRDLLSQARGEIFHPHPERLALWAWPVSGLT